MSEEKVSSTRKRETKELVYVAVAMVAASAAFGFVIGYLAAQGDPEKQSAVITGLLPSIVAAVGLVLFSSLKVNGLFAARVVPCLSVFFFAMSLFGGLAYSEYRRKHQRTIDANDE